MSNSVIITIEYEGQSLKVTSPLEIENGAIDLTGTVEKAGHIAASHFIALASEPAAA